MKVDEEIKQQFADPDPTYRPQPFWFLNHEYKQEELEWQLDEMERQGVGGVVLHSRHGKTAEYMSREYLDMLAFCIEACKKRNMIAWLYDEDNWPSGTFGGKLTRQHPEYRMRYLRAEERRHDRESITCLDFAQEERNELIAILAYRVLSREGEDIVLSAQPEDLTELRGQDWQPSEPDDYVILAFWECEVAEKITFGAGYYLDTLNPEAVRAFIELGYEPFNEFSEHFGHTVQGVFTDEPGLMIHDGFFGTEAIRTDVHKLNNNLPGYVLGWTRNLLTRFQSEYGYSLLPLLGALLYEIEDVGHAVREHYYSALTRWYVDAYHRSLRQWCEERGLAYIGHTLEEPLWGQARSQGNQTKVLQQFHYPGVDYLTRGIGTKDNPYRILSVKCASSVAYLEGKARVICEAFGASDHGYSMRERRKDANFMAFLGVNLFIPHAFYYSFEGYRKTDFPQTEFYHAPHWEHYRTFGDYIGRLSMLGSLGKQTSKVLLVSPIHTVYHEMFRNGEAKRDIHVDQLFSMLSDRLIRQRIDFEYVDEAQIEVGAVMEGEMKFAECEGSFSIILLPAMKVMSVVTSRRLLEFVRSGGTLLALEELPVHSMTAQHDAELKQYIDQMFPEDAREEGWHACGSGQTLFLSADRLLGDDAAGLCAEIRNKLADLDYGGQWIVPESDMENVVITGRRLMGTIFVWLFNWSDDAVELQYGGAEGIALEEWDLETGEIRLLGEQERKSFPLAPGQLRIVALEPGSEGQEAKNSACMNLVQAIELSPDWDFKPEDPNVLILDRWEVTMNDRQARLPVTMPGQVNTFRSKIKVEADLISFLEQQNGIYLVLDDLPQVIPSHIGFLSRRRSVEIFVNEQRLPALEPSEWQDRFYYWTDIAPYLKEGANTVEILTFSLLEPMPNFAYPAFLAGSFALTNDSALTAPKQQISGYWTSSGYPYLSGKGLYGQTFDWQPPQAGANNSDNERMEVELEIEGIRETARLWINGHDAGTRLWPPYRWSLTEWIRPGVNRIELQVANTLDNIYGKHVLDSGIEGLARINVYSK